MNPGTKQHLRAVSTATLCTALFKRRLKNQFIQDVRPLNPGLPNMVGPAFTLRYIPAREDLNTLAVFQDRQHPQRQAVEQCPPGAVLVMDSRKNARAASAGAILVSRLMVRGVAGVVTDGGFRDSPEIARLAIPAYHQRPSAPTNLTLHRPMHSGLVPPHRRAEPNRLRSLADGQGPLRRACGAPAASGRRACWASKLSGCCGASRARVIKWRRTSRRAVVAWPQAPRPAAVRSGQP